MIRLTVFNIFAIQVNTLEGLCFYLSWWYLLYKVKFPLSKNSKQLTIVPELCKAKIWYYFITVEILRQLSRTVLTNIYYSIFWLTYFPKRRTIIIIMVQKSGKTIYKADSYKQLGWLTILAKSFEKLLLRLDPYSPIGFFQKNIPQSINATE